MHLEHWLAVASTPSGLLPGHFDLKWKPLPGEGNDLTTQARLIFVMARGYEHTGDRRYRDVAERGTNFLLQHFYDPVHGGFFLRVDAQGHVLNDTKNTYGHAFALLALAHMARITKEDRYRAAALAAWKDIDHNLRDEEGGFRPKTSRNFAAEDGLRTQNPVMHMFEALLALLDATDDESARAGARSVGNFVLYKLMQGHPDGGASIPEWYNAHWKPLKTREEGGYTDLGHQFEWVHLLLSAEKRGVAPLYGASAERILQFALKHGYDDQDGGAFNRQFPDGSVDRDKYWWGQAEAIRALLLTANLTARNDLWRRYEQTVGLVREQIADPNIGGWRYATKRKCEAGGCPSAQLEPYHMVGMHMMALELAGEQR